VNSKKLSQEFAKAKAENDNVKKLLNEHNLYELFQSKPEMVIRRVNMGIIDFNNQMKKILEEDNE
jgi:hypothetical protein